MAKPNYSFEKRQRDLAKKARQDEKRRIKREGKAAGNSDDTAASAGDIGNGGASATSPVTAP